MPLSPRPAIAALALMALAGPVAAAARVVTDIAPVHSIVARVMQGIGAPELVVPPGASPHGFALRPSAARTIAEADAVIWVGEALTPWLTGTIEALATGEVLELTEVDGLTLLETREGGAFEAHHDDHDHAHGHEHHHGPVDAHVWLDPRNATVIAAASADLLASLDPENAATYHANADGFAAEITALRTDLAARLAPVAGRPYVVFHDSYQYFEAPFGMPAAGSVTLSDAEQPSVARVADIRDRIRDQGITCVFSEPQFEPRLVATLVDETGAGTGVLDPLGADLTPGPELYPALLSGLADALAECLSR